MAILKAPLGFCPTPGCSNRSNGLCEAHRKGRQRLIDERRGSRHARGYGSTWDRVSAKWKATHPFCGMRADMKLHPEHSICVQRGIRYAGGPGNRLVTDHIVPKEQGGADDENNFQTVCERCHNVKRATEDKQTTGGTSFV